MAPVKNIGSTAMSAQASSPTKSMGPPLKPPPPIPLIKVTKNQSVEALPETPSPAPGDESPSLSQMYQSSAENAAELRDSDSPVHSQTKSFTKTSPHPKTSGDSPVSPTRSQSWKNENNAQKNETTVDPLSLHILRRTGTSGHIPQSMRVNTSESIATIRAGEEETDPTLNTATTTKSSAPSAKRVDSLQNKKKGVSFLSRFMGKKKEEEEEEVDDNDSVAEEQRTEGLDAAVFSQPIGFKPQFPPPPKYIRVRGYNKPKRDFNRLFLAQELQKKTGLEDDAASRKGSVNPNGSQISLALPKHKSGAIWAMKFSKDGRYLAAGGQDMVVSVWEVLASHEDRMAFEREEDNGDISGASIYNGSIYNGNGSIYSGTTKGGTRLSCPVFRSEPFRQYVGHTADVLDLSWSKNNFLLSSSMDKTVRLWHISRRECLCAFQHSDFVTSILFHPRDDRFFLAGSLDSKLRLWSIPDKNVAYYAELPDLITAVSFSPDGKLAIAGCLSGLCLFYETEGLKYHTQIHVRSSHGRNAKGSKITGIQTSHFPPGDPNGEIKLLITSNDSRVRLYHLRDKSIETKFKGYENTCSQIHASFSDDSKYVISGSEDRKIYIWNTQPGLSEKKTKRPVEYFEAHPAIVTCAIMAPTKTKQLLSGSGDPIFDLCNPPPVVLISRSESFASSTKNTRRSDDRPESRNTKNIDSGPPTPPRTADTKKPRRPNKPEESPAYIARTAHPGGNIIVSADYTGKIKVFRQDCAFLKRKNESWETSSAFSKRIGTGLFSGPGRRGSVTQTPQTPDRIQSWRNSISSNHSLDNYASSLRGGRTPTVDNHTPTSRNRSVSPHHSVSRLSVRSSHGTPNNGSITNSNGSASNPKISGLAQQTPMRRRADSAASKRSNAGSVNDNSKNNHNITANNNSSSGMAEVERIPSNLSRILPKNDDNLLYMNEVGQSMQFYNLKTQPQTAAGHLSPEGRERRSSSITTDGSNGDFTSESESEQMRCKKCNSTSFRARKTKAGEAKLVCTKCNTII